MATGKNRIGIEVGFTVDRAGLNEITSSLKKVQQEMNKASSSGTLTKELKQAGEAAKQLEDILDQSWNSKLGQLDLSKFNNSITKSYGNINNLKKALEASGSSGVQAFNQIATNILRTNVQLTKTNATLERIATTFKNTIRYGFSSSIFNSMTAAIQQAYNYSIKLDSSLNDIRIVTNKSAEDMERFARQANTASKALGASTLDYTNASLIYYQQGLSDEEVAARAETTIKAANVTGQRGAEVSEQLTAVWNGYKVTAEETELYIDKLAAVAATTASDLEELSVGMSKVASAASAMGVDFDDLNAQIATIVSVTRQAPESVGTALKTIYARLGDLKVDGVDEFGTKLGEVSSQLQTMGIEILDQNGNMRDMSSVMAEVAEKWDGWTRSQQQAAAVAMAGKRQYNNLVALFENWDMYSQAFDTSTQALGTLQQQQDTYMESTEAHLQKLKTESERTYDILFNTDTVNSFADGLTGVLGQFNDFIDGLGGGAAAFTHFGALVANIFNKQIGTEINRQIENFRIMRENMQHMAEQQKIAHELAIGEVQSSYGARGINIDNNLATIQKEAAMREQMLSVSQQLTQEEMEQLTATQARVGDLEREIEELESYKDLFNDIFRGIGGEKVRDQDLLDWEENQRENIKALKAEYKDFSQYIDELGKTNNLAYFLSDFEEGLERSIDSGNEGLEDFASHLQQIQSEDEKINYIQSNKQVILSTQNQSIKDQEQLLQLVFQAGENRVKVDSGEVDILRLQTEELRKQHQAQIDAAKQAQNLAKATQMASGGIQAASAAVGALNAGLSASATGADKANAIFSGISGTAAGIANMFIPGSGILVQGIASVGKGILEITGLWDKFEDSLKSTEERLEEVNQKMQEFVSTSSEFKTSTTQLEELADEYDKLSQKAGEYDRNIDSLTETERKKYNELKETILKYNDEALLGYNERGEAILNTNEGIKETIALLKEQYEIERKTYYNESFNDFTKAHNESYQEAKGGLQTAETDAKNARTGSLQNQYLQDQMGLIRQITDVMVPTTKEGIEAYAELQEITNQGILTARENKDRINELILTIAGDENLQAQADQIRKYGENIQDILNAVDIAEDETVKAEQDLQLKSIIDSSGVLNVIKYVEDHTEEYDKLSALAEQQGIESIDIYLLSYINGLKLGKDAESYDEIYKLAEDFANELYTILSTNPSLYNSISKAGEDFSKLTFESYQDYINQLVAQINQILSTNPELAALEPKVKEAIFGAIFGTTGLTFDTNGLVTNVNTQYTEAFNNLQNHIQELTGQNIDRQSLTSLLGIEDVSDIDYIIEELDKAKVSSENWEQVIENIAEKLKVVRELSDISSKLTNISGATNTLLNGDNLSEEQITQLEELESEYGELATIQDRQSKEYLNKLLEIREALEEEKIRLKQLQEETLINELDLHVTDDNSIEEIEDKLKEICEADYEVLVEIKSDTQDDFDTAVKAMEDIDDIASKIGEDFIVAAEDIEELNDVFPGILANMTLVGDGTVRLNEEVVQSAMNAAQAEVAADTDATVQKLQNQADELFAKRDAAQQIADSATRLAKHQSTLSQEEGTLNENLSKLKSDNSTEVSDQEQEDETHVADTAAQTATSMANSFGQAYQVMAEDAVKWADIAHSALIYATDKDATAPTTAGGFGGAGFSTTANVSAAQSNKADLSSYSDYGDVTDWQAVADSYASLAKSYDEAGNNLIGKMGELVARGQGIGNNLSNRGSGAGDGKSKSGGGSGKEKQDEKEIKDEIDTLHKYKKAIETADIALSRLDQRKEHLQKHNLISVLTQENKLIKGQIKNYNQLIKAEKEIAGKEKYTLKQAGAKFDKNNNISNYAELQQSLQDQYNAAVKKYNASGKTDSDKAALDMAKQMHDDTLKLMKSYEDHVKEIEDYRDKKEEKRLQGIKNRLTKFETKMQIRLDKQEFNRDLKQFTKEINEDFKTAYKDYTAEVKYNSEYGSSFKATIDDDKRTYDRYVKELQKIKDGGKSTLFDTADDAQKAIEEVYKTLQEHVRSMKDAFQETWEAYLDGIDQAADKFDELQDRFDKVSDELEFQGQLIELIYGEEAYDLMNNLYEGQNKASLNRIQALKAESDMWYKELQKSGALSKDMFEWNEDEKKYYQQWQDAQKALKDEVINDIEIIKKQYENSINSIFKTLEKGLTGNKLSDVESEWERISAQADRYYDSVEGAYQIQTLANKMDQDIAATTSLKAQQRLQKVRDQELAALREKDKLTEYDIKRAELRYQLELKQMALEDARNNKTGMKLTRNDQGNWSYQYVADETDVASKRQELLDTWNELYQLSSDAYEANLKSMQELTNAYLEKSKELADQLYNNLITEEEYTEKMRQLNEEYYTDYDRLAEENAQYREDLEVHAAGLLLEIYNQDKTAYESMTTEEKALIDGLKAHHLQTYQGIEDAIKQNLDNIRTYSDENMEKVRDDWISKAQEMIDRWNKDDGKSVKDQVNEAYKSIIDINEDYQDDLDILSKQAGIDFGEQGVKGAIDEAAGSTEDLRDKTIDLVNQTSPALDNMRNIIKSIGNAWDDVASKTQTALGQIQDALKEVKSQADKTKNAIDDVANAGTSNGNGSGGSGGGSDSGSPNGDSPSTKKNKDASKEQSNYYIFWAKNGADPTLSSNRHVVKDNMTKSEANSLWNTNAYDYVNSVDKTKRYYLKYHGQIDPGYNGRSYDTGGYTGAWGNSGKLAVLHEKELVLNKQDTENFLSGISMIRDMSSLNGSISNSIMKAMSNMMLSLSGIKTGTVNGGTGNSNTENVFNITAEFPNAENVNEIREAILSLPNIASQFVNEKKL